MSRVPRRAPATPLPAAIYCRISDDREGTEKGVDRQREDCLALAERLGLAVAGVYVDNDISASTRSSKPRPQYAAMLREARAGTVGAILAYSNSRLTRRPREVEDLIELHERHGVRLHTVVSGDDNLSTADGRMMARVKGNVDTHEAEQTGERVARQKQAAAEEGRYRGGRRPFGYQKGGIKIRESEARAVREATAAVLAGRSLAAVAREMNQAGYRTSFTRKKWTTGLVRELLVRPRNAGLVAHGHPLRTRAGGAEYDFEIVAEAKWPALVDRETWEALVALLAEPSRRTNPGGGGRSPGWLGTAGGYVCGIEGCGAPLRVQFQGQTPSHPEPRRGYYRCTQANHLSADQAKTDAFVRGVVAERIRDPRIIALLTPAAPDLSPDRERRMAVAASLAQTQADYDNDLIDGARYREKSQKKTAELALIDAKIAAALQQSVASPVLTAPDPGAAFLAAPVDVQRAILAAVVHVEVLPTPYRGATWTHERLAITPVVRLDETGD